MIIKKTLWNTIIGYFSEIAEFFSTAKSARSSKRVEKEGWKNIKRHQFFSYLFQKLFCKFWQNSRYFLEKIEPFKFYDIQLHNWGPTK